MPIILSRRVAQKSTPQSFTPDSHGILKFNKSFCNSKIVQKAYAKVNIFCMGAKHIPTIYIYSYDVIE